MPFASMTDEDVHAFYQLLDEYFESRKDMFAGWANAGNTAAAAPAARRPTPSSGGRMMAPPAPPIQNAHRPVTPQSPAAIPAAAPTAPPPRASTASNNKYGITVPSMEDFRDPRFQSAFKFAGSSMSAAGGLLNKHVLGGQNYNNSPQAAEPAPVAAPPPKASKPSPFRAGGLGRSAASPPPPPPHAAPASNRGIGTCTAQFDYNSGEASDLTFREGDRIDILAKESADWWRGSLHGREGLFPATYVAED